MSDHKILLFKGQLNGVSSQQQDNTIKSQSNKLNVSNIDCGKVTEMFLNTEWDQMFQNLTADKALEKFTLHVREVLLLCGARPFVHSKGDDKKKKSPELKKLITEVRKVRRKLTCDLPKDVRVDLFQQLGNLHQKYPKLS